MKLTPALVQKIIQNNPKIDQIVDYDEPGKAIIWLTDGWTWEAADGNRSVEGFNLSDNHLEEPDTVSYIKKCISNIEPINPDYY